MAQSLLFYTCTSTIVLLQSVNAAKRTPIVQQQWIFVMIGLGFISFILLIGLLTMAIYRVYQKVKIEKKEISRYLVILDFANITFNAIACFEWAFLRTNLFINLTVPKCTIIYITNYLFYMVAKYCLHILLLYRLYRTFNNTVFKIKKYYAKLFVSVITINFIVFTSLWMTICFGYVAVGISSDDSSLFNGETLQFCTLYNNHSHKDMTFYEKVWPVLFGLQDFFVGVATLAVFVYKIHEVFISPDMRDSEIERIIRKSFILGVISIGSTFILYTFAIPFYPNLTFLLPFDALINSFCVALLKDWTHSLYIRICCVCDTCFRLLKHEKVNNHTANNFRVRVDGGEIGLQTVPSNTLNQQNETGLQTVPSNSIVTPSIDEGIQIKVMYYLSKSNVRRFGKSLNDLKVPDMYTQTPKGPLPLSESRFVKSSFL